MHAQMEGERLAIRIGNSEWPTDEWKPVVAAAFGEARVKALCSPPTAVSAYKGELIGLVEVGETRKARGWLYLYSQAELEFMALLPWEVIEGTYRSAPHTRMS